MKFKVGDRVKRTRGAIWWIGYCGTVLDYAKGFYAVEYDKSDPVFHTCSGLGKDKFCFWTREEYLELMEKGKPKRTVVIEITDDGADAKFVCGKKVKKTASIKRYHKDKPNDYRAAIFSVGKLFGRELKITEAGVSLSADEVRKMKDSLKNAQGYLDDAKVILERNAAEK